MNYIDRLLISVLTVLMLCCPVFAADSSDGQSSAPTGVLAGQFKKNGKTPLANGRLFVYYKSKGLPSSDRYVRVPDQLAELDKDGKFQLQLPAGTYYLSAVKAPAEMVMGPPPKGEPIYFKMNAKKEIQPFTVLAGKTKNAGVISTSLPYKGVGKDRDEAGLTLIEGSVVDENGMPVEGAVILAHLKQGTQEMASFVTERTAKDGKFLLRVDAGGNYYLRVRSEYHGGSPNAGEFVNLKDPKEQELITLNSGEKRTGVIMRVRRQPEKGPLSQGR